MKRASVLSLAGLFAGLVSAGFSAQSMRVADRAPDPGAFAAAFETRLAAVPDGEDPALDPALIRLVVSATWRAVPFALARLDAPDSRKPPGGSTRVGAGDRGVAAIAEILRRERKATGLLDIVRRTNRWTDADRAIHEEAKRTLRAGVDAVKAGRGREAEAGLRRAARALAEVGRLDLEAVGLSTLAALCERRGRLRRALALRERALALVTRLGDELGMGFAHNRLGVVCTLLDDHPAAERHYRQALERFRTVGEDREAAAVLNNTAVLERRRGRLEASIRVQREALRMQTDLGDHRAAAKSLGNLSTTCAVLGRYEDAIRLIDRAFPALKASGDDRILLTHYNNLGNLYALIGLYDEALACHQRVVPILERLGNPDAASLALCNLGYLHTRRGRFEKALECYESADRLFPEPGASRQASRALGMGFVLGRLHEHEAALRHFQRALELSESIGDRNGAARARSNMGSLLFRLGRLNEARDLVERAVAERDPNVSDLVFARLLTLRAVVLHGQEQWGASLEAFDRATAVFERARIQVARLGDEARLSIVENRAWPLLAVDAAYRAGREDRSPAPWSRAFTILERQTGAAMRDLLADSAIDPLVGLDPETVAARHRLNLRLVETRRALERAEQAERAGRPGAGAGRTAEMRARLEQLDRQAVALETRARLKNPAYAGLAYPRGLEAEAVCTGLEEGEVLVSYLVSGSHVHAFVLSRDGVRLFRLGPGREVQRALTLLLGAIRSRRGDAEWRPCIELLSRRLLHPIESCLVRARVITLVPHEGFCFLPFDVLETSSGVAVLDRWPVRHAHSGTVLDELRKRRGRGPREGRRTLLALGDPTYPGEREGTGDGASDPGRLDRLPGTRLEIAAVAAAAGGDLDPDRLKERSVRVDSGPIAVFSGVHATEAVLKRRGFANRFRAVHLACHGRADPECPGLSGLFLAPPPGSEAAEDGYLRLREVFELRLAADVVVLSACDSNVGRVQPLEGAQSLTRAFLFAGTPTVIVSNWPVSDETTPELMATFYRGWLEEGLTPREALRRAKAKLRRVRPHPFHWAGFVLWGLGT